MSQYWVIIVVALVLCLFATVAMSKQKTSKAEEEQDNQMIPDQTINVEESKAASLVDLSNTLAVAFEETTELSEIEQARLVEIKDHEILGRIDQAIPGTAQAVMNTGAARGLHEIGGQIYRAIIPEGAVLDPSRSMEGAVRGSYREVANSIQGNANWMPVDTSAAKKAAALSAGNAVMGAAAMVVGQYYMTQVNGQLEQLSEGIKKLSGFQDNEFKSKVQALLAEVQRLSVFQMEVIQNDELRKRELDNLKALETKCVELLGQANLQIQDYTALQGMAYDEYEDDVRAANKWYQYQNVLLEILYQISELTHALNFGTVSKEYTQGLYIAYAKQTEKVRRQLLSWHENNCKRLGINAEEGTRKRAGLDAVLMAGPALFRDDWRYRKMHPGTVKAIRMQTAEKVVQETDSQDLFQEKVQLVAQDGKLYYLPPIEETVLVEAEEQAQNVEDSDSIEHSATL